MFTLFITLPPPLSLGLKSILFKKKIIKKNVVLVLVIQQSDSAIYIQIFVLFQVLFPYTLLQNSEQSSLCYAVGPYWLSILYIVSCMLASLVAQTAKTLPAIQRPGFNPWVQKIPQRREWKPTPISLPGKSHGQRSLVGYSPQGHKRGGP